MLSVPSKRGDPRRVRITSSAADPRSSNRRTPPDLPELSRRGRGHRAVRVGPESRGQISECSALPGSGLEPDSFAWTARRTGLRPPRLQPDAGPGLAPRHFGTPGNPEASAHTPGTGCREPLLTARPRSPVSGALRETSPTQNRSSRPFARERVPSGSRGYRWRRCLEGRGHADRRQTGRYDAPTPRKRNVLGTPVRRQLRTPPRIWPVGEVTSEPELVS